MQLFRFAVFLQDAAGRPHEVGAVMAATKDSATRKAHALYGATTYVVSEASRRADGGRTEKLLARFRDRDRRWLNHRFSDEDD